MTDVSGAVQKRADLFEQEVQGLMKRLGLRNVAGGRGFVIGGVQVDACGGHEDTLFVVDCVIKDRRGKKTVREKIKTSRGVLSNLKRGFRSDEKYEKYRRIVPIVATKGFTISEEDKNFAQEKPEVQLWSEQLIEHYSLLSTSAGRYACFSLLGEMEIRPRVESRIQVPAFRWSSGNDTMYMFAIEPERLLRCAYVARREIGQEAYYQRALKASRVKKVEDFVRDGGRFANNIIVSFRTAPKFNPYHEPKALYTEWPSWLQVGVLSFPDTYRSCFVIDGQHRLYGYRAFHGQATVPVVAFDKLKTPDQAKLFIEINKEQKPVKADLLWDLAGELHPNNREGMIARVVRDLAVRGPLANRIYVPSQGARKKRNQLSFAGLCGGIEKRRLLRDVTETSTGNRRNPLLCKSPEDTVKKVARSLRRYFEQVDSLVGEQAREEFFYSTDGGVAVALAIFERILSFSKAVPDDAEFERFVGALGRCIEDQHGTTESIRDLRRNCTSEASRSEVIVTLVSSIRDETQESKFGGNLAEPLQERTAHFERAFAGFVCGLLGIYTLEDLKRCAPPEIYGKIRKRSSPGSGLSPAGELGLGNCRALLGRSDNWAVVKEAVIGTDSVFEDEMDFFVALGRAAKLRNAVHHAKGPLGGYREKEMAIIDLDRLEKCVSQYDESQTGSEPLDESA